MIQTPSIAVVVIGRNEGQRLVACLASLVTQGVTIVYVDSGSDDNSIAEARKAGATVVDLDTSVPFTAARARNAGFEALRRFEMPDLVQFIDGDCVVEQGWIAAAQQAMSENPSFGIVTGWRSEIYPEASVYNDMCDFEWHRPAGDIAACGGDMMVRSEIFEHVGGFDPKVIAAEDDEFCVRVRAAGWVAHRLPVNMTRHDAAMTRFGQWWQRAVRSGHGFAQVGDLHPEYFVRERRRVLFYAAVLPQFIILGAVVSLWVPLMALGIYGISYLRTARGLEAEGLSRSQAREHAIYLTISKFPNLLGMMIYHLRKLQGRKMRIIEYK